MNLLDFTVTNELLLYLEKKNFCIQNFLDKIKETNFYLYKENHMLDISYDFCGKKYNKSIITDKSYGFTTALLLKQNGNIVISKRVLGVNDSLDKDVFNITLIHELLHLLSQNNIEKVNHKYVYKTGITKAEYDIFTKFDEEYENSKISINEGITHFLAERIYEEIYNKKSPIKNDYSCVYAIEILNSFLKFENIDWWLDIYLNNKYESLIKLLENKLKLKENFLMNLDIGIKYNKYNSRELNKMLYKIIYSLDNKKEINDIVKKLSNKLPKEIF